MYYVYVLKSNKDNNYYIGSTNDLRRRFKEHQQGRVESTKNRIPFELICYEAYQTKQTAQAREKFLKTSDGHKELNLRFKT